MSDVKIVVKDGFIKEVSINKLNVIETLNCMIFKFLGLVSRMLLIILRKGYCEG